ncbi:3-hydroxybutyrate dehydrogenase [Desulfofundulus thermocisternus]|uniref:3-hydroxybutyrate dehydrogenase n=1 Tax=Desulfofundulus thermocisternus TaxID=42471 RepID=UPI00068C6B39|nr:3-hydroxybutyrate dehydrogenase [Desulfofundulus thermocisternus]
MAKDLSKINFSVDLTGRTALVTGAGSGIGYGVARVLRGAGAKVLVNDILPERAKEAARVLEGEPFPGDITRPEFIEQVRERQIDILVNNAGFQHVSPLESFPPEVFRRLLEVMLVGPFLLCQAVVPGMRARGFGRIINIASVHAKIASAYKAGYVSAKHGLLGLTRVVALETATDGITVNAICPGYVDTPLVRNQLKDLAASHNLPPEQVLDQVILMPVPQKRLLTPEEIGYLALFLCSDAASSITAQGYTIDGGWSQI